MLVEQWHKASAGGGEGPRVLPSASSSAGSAFLRVSHNYLLNNSTLLTVSLFLSSSNFFRQLAPLSLYVFIYLYIYTRPRHTVYVYKHNHFDTRYAHPRNTEKQRLSSSTTAGEPLYQQTVHLVVAPWYSSTFSLTTRLMHRRPWATRRRRRTSAPRYTGTRAHTARRLSLSLSHTYTLVAIYMSKYIVHGRCRTDGGIRTVLHEHGSFPGGGGYRKSARSREWEREKGRDIDIYTSIYTRRRQRCCMQPPRDTVVAMLSAPRAHTLRLGEQLLLDRESERRDGGIPVW